MLTWAQLEHTTARWGPGVDAIIVARATTLAPVPLKASLTTTSASNSWLKAASQRVRVLVLAVGQGVAGVGGRDRLDHGRMSTGGVVAGERAGRRLENHADQLYEMNQ